MVFRMESNFIETIEMLDIKNFAATSTVFNLPSEKNKTSNLFLLVSSLLPNEGKVNTTIEDNRPGAILATNTNNKIA